MANKANFTLTVSQTPKQNGWCELYAGLLLAGRSGLYPTAFAAYQAVPQKRGGTPPDDGNYYLPYYRDWETRSQCWNGENRCYRKMRATSQDSHSAKETKEASVW